MKYISEIDNLNSGKKKYVIEFNNKFYEADDEQDIMQVLIKGYTEVDDSNQQLLYRMDLARGLEMLSLVNDKNVEVFNGKDKVKENYAVDPTDCDYESDYDKADFILNVESERTLFIGVNELEYAKVFEKEEKMYRLI